jgi:hypothetical protein
MPMEKGPEIQFQSVKKFVSIAFLVNCWAVCLVAEAGLKLFPFAFELSWDEFQSRFLYL